jgi:hypothetical protein
LTTAPQQRQDVVGVVQFGRLGGFGRSDDREGSGDGEHVSDGRHDPEFHWPLP